jgi:hypothetical protein
VRKGLATAICFACLVTPNAAFGDDDIPNILPPEDHGARTLRGHTFIEPATQETAFITSHIGLRQGVAYYSVPKFPLGGGKRAGLAIFGLEEQLDLQVRIFPWLALHGVGEAFVASGLDQASVFYGNSGFVAGGRGGPVIRLYRSRDSGTQITIRGHIGGAAGNALALPTFVQGVAARAAQETTDSAPATTEQLQGRLFNAVNRLSNAAITDTTSIQYGGTVSFAQTVVRMIGIQAGFDFYRRDTVDDRFDPELQVRTRLEGSDHAIRFGVAPSVDLYHLHVPVAVVGEYAMEKLYRESGGTNIYVPSGHYFGGGIYYSGRTDLQLGVSAFMRRNLKPLQVTAVDGTRAETGVPTELHGQFVLRYVWN